MSDWPTVRLSDCCRIVSGATPKTGVGEYWDGEIEWATPKDLSALSSTYIGATERRISARGLASCSAEVLPPRSVLLSSRAPIGHVAINTRPMATNQGFKSFVPDIRRVHPEFLYYWLTFKRPYLESLGSGATFKEVSRAVVARIEIPLPPLEEQKRIAAILDAAEALREKRRQSAKVLDHLVWSMFEKVVGDPVKNPHGLPMVAVGDIVEAFETGKNIAASEDDSDVHLRVLKVSAVTKLEFNPSESKPLPTSYSPPAKHFVRPGDLLFSRANTTELIGATAFVWATPENIVLPDKIWRFVWKSSVSAEPLFMWYLFRHPSVRAEIGKRATGTSGSMRNISQGKVLSIRVPWPPPSVQLNFASAVKQAQRMRVSQQRSREFLNSLVAVAQQRAFCGEL
ncbi:MAG TPA: restriction endonuclease subunit S [Thermoanaerobaculia bacterium]|nr:restriction endonuclease subunit S [Thermoanaerobaculia bacterium]